MASTIAAAAAGLHLNLWRTLHSELRQTFSNPEAVYAALYRRCLESVAEALQLPAGNTPEGSLGAAEQAWVAAAIARLQPDLAKAGKLPTDAAAVTAILERMAAAHELWRAGSDGIELPGVFYTPADLVTRVCTELAVLAGVKRRTQPARKAAGAGLRVLDPAVGCGAFLVGWLEVVGAGHSDRTLPVAEGLHGWDLDPVAVELTRWRILAMCAGAFAQGWATAEGGRALVALQRRLQAQILCVDALRQPQTADFDVVVGNPPFLFLSGKNSPVARASGRRAAQIKAYYAEQIERFPESSAGCRDYCKWFLQLAVGQTKPGGWLAMVTTNTWLYLRQYRDIRRLLRARTRLRTVCDLGYGVFERPTLGAAYFCAQRLEAGAGVSAAGADGSAGALRFWRRERGTETRLVAEWKDDGIEVFRSAWARRLYRRGDLIPLGQLMKVAEGEHGVKRAGLESAAKAGARRPIPIFEDQRLQSLQAPAVRWWPAAAAPAVTAALRARHSGPRALLRKTGAGLVAAMAATEEFALAHQNLYVVRSTAAEIPVAWLVLWLTSRPVQRLYQEGPHGQPGRPLAQLRIANLQRLPAPPVDRWVAAAGVLNGLLRTQPAALTAATGEVRAWQRQLARAVEFLLRPENPGAQRSGPPRLPAAEGPVPRRLRKARSGIK